MRNSRVRFLPLLILSTAAIAMLPTSYGQVSPPIGTVMAYAGPIDKNWENTTGWMLCDGRALNPLDPKTKALFQAIQFTWGGDGKNSFNLPNLNGKFIRGVDQVLDDASGKTKAAEPANDADRDKRRISGTGGSSANHVGSLQDDAIQTHKHSDNGHVHGYSVINNKGGVQYADGGDQVWAMKAPTEELARQTAPGHADITEPTTAGTRAVSTANETRPLNAYVYWIIRYK